MELISKKAAVDTVEGILDNNFRAVKAKLAKYGQPNVTTKRAAIRAIEQVVKETGDPEILQDILNVPVDPSKLCEEDIEFVFGSEYKEVYKEDRGAKVIPMMQASLLPQPGDILWGGDFDNDPYDGPSSPADVETEDPSGSGIDWGAVITGTIPGIFEVFFGDGPQQTPQGGGYPYPQQPQRDNSNLWLWVGGGILGFTLLLIVIFALRK